MEEVLDVYERPHDESCPVVCLDESPHQLIGETRHSFMNEGIRYVDYEYRRAGVADIFMIAEPKRGKRFVQVKDTHNSHQWASVVAHIAEQLYPQATRITLIQDNLTAHRKAAFYEIFEPKRARDIVKRIEFVHTPKHGSWLNIAEIELSVLNRVALKQRIKSKVQLEQQIKTYMEEKNNKAKPVNWQFTSENARTKLNKLYPNV
jgi:ribosomal protein S13